MAKVRIVTFGCSNNVAEGEIMAGLLREYGYDIVESGEDISIINLCSVKGPSLNKGIREARNSSSKVIFSGCIPRHGISKLLEVRPDASLLNTHSIENVVDAVEQTLAGRRVEYLEESRKAKLCLPRHRKNSIVAIIPISSGCVSSCSYCAVKAIKGSLFSYPPEKIVWEIKESLADGCRELWVTAQDTGCYGEDIGKDLPFLLDTILDLEGNFMVRLGMANPAFVHKHLDAMVSAFNHPKMFKFLHVPLQSGSDNILNAMRRNYTARTFREIVERFRKEIPDITISTDMIVGFPGETEKDFQDSMDLLEDVRPDILNLNRFWAMPGTAAAKMKPLPSEIIKERSLKMALLFDEISLERNQRWIGWEGSVIIDEKGKAGTFIGRNFAYKPVVLKGAFQLGEELRIRVEKATLHDLRASKCTKCP